jgi:hypothetical protein
LRRIPNGEALSAASSVLIAFHDERKAEGPHFGPESMKTL